MTTTIEKETETTIDSLLAKIDFALGEIGHKTIVEAPVMVDLLLDIRTLATTVKDT